MGTDQLALKLGRIPAEGDLASSQANSSSALQVPLDRYSRCEFCVGPLNRFCCQVANRFVPLGGGHISKGLRLHRSRASHSRANLSHASDRWLNYIYSDDLPSVRHQARSIQSAFEACHDRPLAAGSVLVAGTQDLHCKPAFRPLL